MMDLLFRHGAKVADTSKWGCIYYFLHVNVAKHLLDKGTNPNHKNWHHTTLLHDAVYSGSVEKAQLLLEYGADTNAIDEEYRSTPLGLAARAGRLELVELLLDRGVDPTAAWAPWATPLNWARKRRHQEIVALIDRRDGG